MRILLVEDEAPLRETLSARLKREGFAVDAAQDGEEGLYMGREVPFDLGIIDLGLPKMSGTRYSNVWPGVMGVVWPSTGKLCGMHSMIGNGSPSSWSCWRVSVCTMRTGSTNASSS